MKNLDRHLQEECPSCHIMMVTPTHYKLICNYKHYNFYFFGKLGVAHKQIELQLSAKKGQSRSFGNCRRIATSAERASMQINCRLPVEGETRRTMAPSMHSVQRKIL